MSNTITLHRLQNGGYWVSSPGFVEVSQDGKRWRRLRHPERSRGKWRYVRIGVEVVSDIDGKPEGPG